jgi:hypothetical protein
MRYVKAFVLGTVAVAVLAGVAAAVLSAVATSGSGPDLELSLGPLLLLSVEHAGGATESTIGAGLGVLALLGGAVNAGALHLIVRRGRRPGPMA